ncbi:hypothetical protein CBS9595_001495 [Malassezia furfur]|nr:hypothetical protein CBS9595_001495 [Malassezia furfur]
MKCLYSAVVLSLALCGCASGQQTDGKPLTYKIVQQDSLASAMMLGLADENTAFILDKVEGNKKLTNTGKPTWSSLVNLTDFSMKGLDAATNPFCAAGMTLGNGTYIVVGGNKAVSYGGATPQGGDTGPYAPYHDQDGRRVVRIMEPADNSGDLQWIDQYNSPNQMDSERWYPGIEGLADGSVVIIGGATSGGYINRNFPNVDPAYETMTTNPVEGDWAQGGANPSYEFWPPTNKPQPAKSNFMVNTSGLNMYPHTYLMPSGKIFMQANYSTTLWDPYNNKEEGLPDMPGEIIRVYPASAATAMLPLTPANNYTPTILFCGGSTVDADKWGNYTAPGINMYHHTANTECHSITPEKSDGSAGDNVNYVHEEDLPEGRSMGQFIQLPDGTMVIVNGAEKGTAGYGNTTWNQAQDTNGNKVYLEGFAQNPTYRPVVYDPTQPKGKRLVYDGFGNSTIARLYHSSAILIPDGSVLVAGSNPHNDVATVPQNLNSKYQGFNTTYELEQWYPKYYFEPRPPVNNVPKYIKYGGDPFNVTVPASFMGKQANQLANRTQVFVIRPGFSTHAVNFGQRSLQLDLSYEVQDSGDVTFIVNPMPTNQNIFVPGPALFFVTVNGVPSMGKMVMIGGENKGLVPFTIKSGDTPPPLPKPVNNPKFDAKVSQSAASLGNSSSGNHNSLSGGAIAGIVIGIVAGVILALAGLLLYLRNRRRTGGGSSKYAALGNNRNAAPAQRTAQSGALGAMPWASQTNESLRPDQTVDESRIGMMQGNDSHASFHDPNDTFGQHHAMGSYATLPTSNSQKVLPQEPQYSDNIPINELPRSQAWSVAPNTSSTGLASPPGPVLYPNTAQDQQRMNTASPTPFAAPLSSAASHTSHLTGPREMPVRSNLQQHLNLSNQNAGNIRPI